MNSNKVWTIALIAVTAVWGWSFVAKQQSLHSISASALNACIFLLGSGVLLPFAFKHLPGLTRRDWGAGVLAGVVLFLAFAFQTSGVSLTTPSNAGFITGLSVVFTPFFLFLASGEKPLGRQVVGGIVALVGLSFLSLNGYSLHAGDLLILICAVFFAVHIVVLDRTRFRSTSLVLAFIQLLTVGTMSLAWSLWAGEFSLPESRSAITATLVIALFGTAIAYYVQTRAQASLSAQRVALLLVFEPIFSGVFGYLLAGDRFSVLNMAGAFMIIVGMIISELDAQPWRRKRITRSLAEE